MNGKGNYENHKRDEQCFSVGIPVQGSEFGLGQGNPPGLLGNKAEHFGKTSDPHEEREVFLLVKWSAKFRPRQGDYQGQPEPAVVALQDHSNLSNQRRSIVCQNQKVPVARAK